MSRSPAPALCVRGLRKRYRHVVAVDGIDLDVPRGECFGLLGPNGAGKTTTIEIASPSWIAAWSSPWARRAEPGRRVEVLEEPAAEPPCARDARRCS